MLIIRHTDYRNSASAPVQYVDYLAATASKDAAVEVRLCEEGDYEVALNYEIRKTMLTFSAGIRFRPIMITVFSSVFPSETATAWSIL